MIPQSDKNEPIINAGGLTPNIEQFSQDKRLNQLLKSVIAEVKLYAEDQIKHIKQLAQIGLALSVEKNISRLLELIVDEARDLSNADAGTLYILDSQKKQLRFEIMQNDSMKTRMGGTSGVMITLPPVQLYSDGKPNHRNVSSYVALTGESVNIPDVYEAEGFDFTGPREYDKATGYRSKSMLVIPLKNHENKIIGVLQLLNAQDPETNEVIAFSPEYEDLIGALASQAAVALTNTQLVEDLKNLFYAFIKSIATAIDEKSPYTGGHITRVVELTMMIAEKINEMNEGPFKDVKLSDDEMEELRLAAWMHDVGKITTPEYIVDKRTKLETIFDRTDLIKTRFALLEKDAENDYLNKKIKIIENGNPAIQDALRILDEEHDSKVNKLNEEYEFIKNCNHPGEFMSDENIRHINEIASKTYSLLKTEEHYLTEDEAKNLSIRKGTLGDNERKIIENHAAMTLKILKQLPFPDRLSRVPEFAGGHHEKLDGTGYPLGLTEKEMPLQTRILGIADVFEALTAKDRPYKKPMKLSEAVKIMGFMKKDKHIDPNIFELFINNKIHYKYAQKEMNPEQID